jgi:hypothetical protein
MMEINRAAIICSRYLADDQFELFNGTLFYNAPENISRKIFSDLMVSFNMKCSISKIESNHYAVDFIG